MGRTGETFAVKHWGIEPDIILTGKGIASGYAPLGAVLVAGNVVEAFEKGSGAFMHGFTYQAHPVCTASASPLSSSMSWCLATASQSFSGRPHDSRMRPASEA